MVGIKGMAMPKDCYDCNFISNIAIGRFCCVAALQCLPCPYATGQRPEWCPLVEVEEEDNG